MKNILNKEEHYLLVENLLNKYYNKYKNELKTFLIKLKEQISHNKKAKSILLNYTQTGNITKEESQILKEISADVLKMLGLGGIVILPGGSLLIIFIIKLAKLFNIDVIPSQFSKS